MAERNWHDKSYKWILIIPAILLVISLAYIFTFYQQNGDIIKRDISLKGGTSITVFDKINIEELEQFAEQNFDNFEVRQISDLRTREMQAFILEVDKKPEEIKLQLEEYLGYNLTDENSSTEFTGPSIGAGFFIQLLKALLAAFVLMALVVFIIFGESSKFKSYMTILAATIVRPLFSTIPIINFFLIGTGIAGFIISLYFDEGEKEYIYSSALLLLFIFSLIFVNSYLIAAIGLIYFSIIFITSVPSLAVVLAALADLLMTLGVVNLLGMRIAPAGIVAFLMLIGYSVDSDILMTTKLLKRRDGTLNARVWSAFKTGITMTLTSLSAVIISLLIVMSLSNTLAQLFTILTIGLSFDLLNTWVSNLGILKWYAENKNIK